MADDIKTPNIEKPKANMESDRAKRINSLHKSTENVIKKQNKKTTQISTEVSALTKEQQKLMKQVETENLKFTNETASAYNGVIKSLGKTIQNLSVGVKNITTDTAKATADAIGQYGRAIGEDININKRNTIAMSLSRATPLLGYFAAKAVETEAFQNLSRKMGEKISNVGKAAFNKIRGKKKEPNFDMDMDMDEIPKMRKGGLVKKKGIVEVHAAEIITPVDKILKKIEHAKAEDNTHKLQTNLSTLSDTVVRMEDFMEKSGTQNQNVLQTFVDELKYGKQRDREGPWQERMLRAIEELKIGMLGISGRFTIAMRRTLLKHPSFKAMLMFGDVIKATMITPFKALFGLRGGFASDVKKATSTSNIYKQQVNLLALIYTKGMEYLRNISKYTKVSAEALVGEEVSPISDKTYTLFGKVKDFMTGKKATEKKTKFETFAEALKLDKASLKEAGISSFSDLLSPLKILRNMGFTKENMKARFAKGKSDEEIVKEAKKKAKKKKSEVLAYIAKKTKRPREYIAKKTEKQRAYMRERAEKSPLYQKLKKTNENLHSKINELRKKLKDKKEKKKDTNIIKELLNKIRGHAKNQEEKLGKVAQTGKTFKDKLFTWIPILWGIFSKLLFPVKFIAKKIGVFLAWVMANTVGKVGKSIFSGAKDIVTNYKAKGVRGAAGAATKNVARTGWRLAKFGGRALGAAAGLGVGGYMTAKDMFQAVKDPGEFKGGVLTRATAAALGGAGEAGKGGATGLKHGLMKGAALGAGVGSIIPGVGTMIGGAIGALGGGILGFIGGEKISIGLDFLKEGIVKFVKGAWAVLTFIPRMAWRGIKFLFRKFKELKILSFLGNMTKKFVKGAFKVVTFVPRMAWRGLKALFRKIKEWNLAENLGKFAKKFIKKVFSIVTFVPRMALKGFKKLFGFGEKKDLKEGPPPSQQVSAIPKRRRATGYEKEIEFQRRLKTGEFGTPSKEYLAAHKGDGIAPKYESLTTRQIRAEKARLRSLADKKFGEPPPITDISDAYHRSLKPEVWDISESYKKSLKNKGMSNLAIPKSDSGELIDVGKIMKGGNTPEAIQANISMEMLQKLTDIRKTLADSSEETKNATLLSSYNISSTVSNALTNNRVVNGLKTAYNNFSAAQDRANTVALANIN